MNIKLIMNVLWYRRALRRRDRWTREQLSAHQTQALASLRAQAYQKSSFYQTYHASKFDRPLSELPILTKAMVMVHFDELVTDPVIRLADIESYIAQLTTNQTYLNKYYVAGTAGTTGRRGLFLWNFREWVDVITSYNRAFDWAGSTAGLTNRVKTAVVSSTNPLHQSARVGASINSRWVPTLRIDSGDTIETIVKRLNDWQPEMLIAYASMARLLAEEQLAGRLAIHPKFIFSASEVLTDSTRRQVKQAWAHDIFNVYGATETSGIAAECSEHSGLHLFEDLVITEIVDENNQPVPPGTYGAKLLVTVLFSHTLPLIRYEMTDSVALSTRQSCPCGRPYALLEGIQGRQQDALTFEGQDSSPVVIQPIVFHQVMDTVKAAGWQIVQTTQGLEVLIAGSEDLDETALANNLRAGLEAHQVKPPQITITEVEAIPRTAMGKAPLIKSELKK